MKKGTFVVSRFLWSQIRAKRKMLKDMVNDSIYGRLACPIDLVKMINDLKLIKNNSFDLIVSRSFTLPDEALDLTVSDELYDKAMKSLKIIGRKRMSKLGVDDLQKVNKALLIMTEQIYTWQPEFELEGDSVLQEAALIAVS